MKKLLALSIFCLVFQSCESKTKETKNNDSKTIKTEQNKLIENPNSIQDNEVDASFSFAKIIDKDGYANIRKKGSNNSEIIGRINSGQTVFIYEDQGSDWLEIDYKDKNNKVVVGYVHRSRIQYIDTLKPIPSTIVNDNEAKFALNNILIQINTDQFNYNANKKYFSEIKHKDYTEKKYKGKTMWGTDGTIPNTFYKSITVNIGNQKIDIPQNDLDDLFNANNDYTKCYLDKNDNSIYILLSNSDGAGAYIALFKIENGHYIERRTEIPF